MGAVTLQLVSQAGDFELVRDDGQTVASGRVLLSRFRPGFVTLTFHAAPVGSFPVPLRVPVDWVSALQMAVEGGAS